MPRSNGQAAGASKGRPGKLATRTVRAALGRYLVAMKLAVLSLALLALVPLADPRSVHDATPRQEPALSDLAWMAGTWSSTADGTLTHEAWLPPAGGLMLGVNRSAAADASVKKRAFYEYLRIEERPDGLVYVASPMGRAPTEFALEDVGERLVVFANREHDFPQEIRYELTAAGALHARVSGTVDGKEQAQEWTWKKQ